MKAIEFNNTSLIHRFATVYGPMPNYATKTDICTYTRSVIKGFCSWLFLMVVAGIVGAGLGDWLAWIAAMLVTGTWPIKPDTGALVVTFFLALAIVIFVVYRGVKAFEQFKRKLRERIADQETTEPSAIKRAYEAFKGKYCVPVVIHRNDQE